MTVLLATLALNEMEWLPRLYAQHREWPRLVRWVFVEAADRVYAEQNPEMVNDSGLSVDGTTEFLLTIHRDNPLVTYIPHGISRTNDPATGKIAARQRYLDVANQVNPEFVIVLDADEFYTKKDQAEILKLMRIYSVSYDSFVFHKREIWRPPSISDQPLFQWEAIEGFWQVPCCHWWKFIPGMAYTDCHNTPSANGRPLNDRSLRHDRMAKSPCMYHLGFASQVNTRLAKNRYYAARGEAIDKQRKWYVESRAAWQNWKPGDRLPHKGKIIPFTGQIPEVFQ